MNRLYKRILTGILTLCMLFSVVWMPAAQAAEVNSPANWMASVSEDALLSQVSIPGTHDSCTKHTGLLSFVFQCQNTTVAEQLQNGYRYFDLRLAIDGEDGEEQTLILKHNFATCKTSGWPFADALTLENVLEQVYGFLSENPTETVILCMKAENEEDDVSTVQKLLYEQIDQHADLWYTDNQIPTVGEVRGKIVLATRFADELGVGENRKGLSFAWEDQGDRTILEDPYGESKINEQASLWVQDRYNYATEDKIDAIQTTLENPQASATAFSLNFTSTSGKGKVGHPKKYAKKINQYLLQYNWQKGTCYGIVVVDFGSAELAKVIYETN